MAIISTDLNRSTIFFIGRFFGKLAVKWLLKIPPLFAYVATLPCEILMSEAVGSLITKLKSFVAESVSKKNKFGKYLAKLHGCLVNFSVF